MRRFLKRPPRPLPAWWPAGRPWPPPAGPLKPMPAWWPEGERWPGSRASRGPTPGGGYAFPVGVAIVFAVLLNLLAGGALPIVRAAAGVIPWPYAWHLGVTALAVATVAGFVVAMRRIGAPLSEIVAAAHRVGDGDLSVRLDEQGAPWLRSVARAFNTMTTGLERQQRERRALMADIAHELRTPLSVIRGRVEGMLDGVYPRDEQQVRQVLEETRTLGRLIEDLRTSANAESGALALRKEAADIDVLVEDVAARFRLEADARRIRIEVALTPPLPPIDVDPDRIREVIGNLLSNALRHSPEGGVVTMACTHHTGVVVLRVMDEGPGIPPADLPRVFERFYRGPGSAGSGLGLAIAKSLVLAHGGAIEARNRQGGGAEVVVTLPV